MSVGASMGCPGSGELKAWIDRELDGPAAWSVETHVSRCARCEEEVAVLRKLTEAISGLGDPVAPPATLRTRVLAALPLTGDTLTPTRKTHPLSQWWPVVRWAAPLTVLAAAVVLAVRPGFFASPGTESPQRMVAPRAPGGPASDTGPGSPPRTKSLPPPPDSPAGVAAGSPAGALTNTPARESDLRGVGPSGAEFTVEASLGGDAASRSAWIKEVVLAAGGRLLSEAPTGPARDAEVIQRYEVSGGALTAMIRELGTVAALRYDPARLGPAQANKTVVLTLSIRGGK